MIKRLIELKKLINELERVYEKAPEGEGRRKIRENIGFNEYVLRKGVEDSAFIMMRKHAPVSGCAEVVKRIDDEVMELYKKEITKLLDDIK